MEASYGRVMAISLLDLLGFGSDRAIANAGREMLRRCTEERLIEDLVEALARHDAPGCPSSPRPSGAGVGPEGPATRTTREAPSRTHYGGTTAYAPTAPWPPWRLDYTTSDEPDALAAAGQGLRALGVTVGTCDVRRLRAGQAAVVGTVALPPWLDVPAVEYVLRCVGATDVRAVPIHGAPGIPLAEVVHG